MWDNFVPFVSGAVVVIIGSLINHYLGARRDDERWRREEPDRAANRDIQMALETRRLLHAHRKERMAPIFEELDAALKPMKLLEYMQSPFAKDLIDPTRIQSDTESLRHDVLAHVVTLLRHVPLITDSEVERQLTRCTLIIGLPVEKRSEALGDETLDQMVAGVYAALERYVISEN